MTVSARGTRRLQTNVTIPTAVQETSKALCRSSSKISDGVLGVAKLVARSAEECAAAAATTWGVDEPSGCCGEQLIAAEDLRQQVIAYTRIVEDTARAITFWRGVSQTQQQAQAALELVKKVHRQLERARSSYRYGVRRALVIAVRLLIGGGESVRRAQQAAEDVATAAVDTEALDGIYRSRSALRRLLERARTIERSGEADAGQPRERVVEGRLEVLEELNDEVAQLAQQATVHALLAAVRAIPSSVVGEQMMSRQESTALGSNLYQVVVASSRLAIRHQRMVRARRRALAAPSAGTRQRQAAAVAAATRELVAAAREATEALERALQLTLEMVQREAERDGTGACKLSAEASNPVREALGALKKKTAEARRMIDAARHDSELLVLAAQSAGERVELQALLDDAQALDRRAVQVCRHAIRSCRRVLRLVISLLAADSAFEAAALADRHAALCDELALALAGNDRAVETVLQLAEEAGEEARQVALLSRGDRGLDWALRTPGQIAQDRAYEQRSRRRFKQLRIQLAKRIRDCRSAAEKTHQKAAEVLRTDDRAALTTAADANQAATETLELARRANQLALSIVPFTAERTAYAAVTASRGSVAAESAASSLARAEERQRATQLQAALRALSPPPVVKKKSGRASGAQPESVLPAGASPAKPEATPAVEDPRWPRPDMIDRYHTTQRKYRRSPGLK